MSLSSPELEVAGYQRVYDYTNYSHVNHVNVIPENDFKRLVEDTFKTITETLRATYGPYASTVMISSMNETTSTKDGFNVFSAMGFSHAYKQKVYLTLKAIIDRVNDHVGDGTTSCILLAEKIFHNLENHAKTTEDKVKLFKVLNMIEKGLQNPKMLESDREDCIIRPLTKDALHGLVNLAGNYDEELTNVITSALKPEYNDYGVITSIRNVVVESKLERDGESTTSYDIDYLPGNYRVRVKMENEEMAMLFYDTRKIRVAIYDHAFTSSDWNFFMHEFDKETDTLIIARDFNVDFKNTEYFRYLRDRRTATSPIRIFLATVKGTYIRDEISDLAAVLGVKPIGLHAKAVDHNSLPEVPVQIYKGNCMCFDVDTVPEKYIEELKYEMNTDTSESLIKKKTYADRIRALSLRAQDTLITVKSGTSLELKVIADKIADCIAIVESALEWGIVPNSLVYGYSCIYGMNSIDPMFKIVTRAICESIKDLFKDIWISKHGYEEDSNKPKCSESMEHVVKNMFETYASTQMRSYNIITESFEDVSKFPTSAQYDLEVIVASISIVKYLLTSRAFIFDAHLMTQVNDEGHYQQM